jgi:hypothetical protein
MLKKATMTMRSNSTVGNLISDWGGKALELLEADAVAMALRPADAAPART